MYTISAGTGTDNSVIRSRVNEGMIMKNAIDDLKAKGRAAKLASRRLAYISTDIKNKALTLYRRGYPFTEG